MNKLHTVAFMILIVGGFNWLVFGLFGWEVGEVFGGPSAAMSRIIYILVGLSAIYEVATHRGRCKACAKNK